MRLLPWVLALAPLFPPIALLAPVFLGYLRWLSSPALGLLGIYALTVIVPALGAPEPLALTLALGRVLYALGLVGAGAALMLQARSTERALKPLGYGLLLLYSSAFLTSYLALGDRVVGERLGHPFYNPVGLGFAGTVGILLAIHVRFAWPWRILLGLLGGAVLLLTGSRGGMLALVLAGVTELFVRRRWLWTLGVTGLLVVSAAVLDVGVTKRFFEAHLSGRESIWLRAYELYRNVPWTGVGPYVSGDYLRESLSQSCVLLPSLATTLGLTCPPWLRSLGSFWTFAHNHLLQALVESGIPGAIGLVLLLGGFLAAAWGDPLLLTLLIAFVAMGISDYPAEFLFLLGGIALVRGMNMPASLGFAGLVVFLWSLPFLYLATRPSTPPPALAYLAFPKEGVGFLRLVGAQGYRVQVWLCQKDCQRVGWEWRGDEPMYFPLPQDLPKGEYRLRVLLLSQHRLALKPRYVLEKEVRW